MKKIKQIEMLRVKLPLKKPYLTSLGEFTYYDSVFVIVTAEDGMSAIGESTAVLGYSWESPYDVWNFGESYANQLIHKNISDASRWLTTQFSRLPFSTTPFLTAFEQLNGDPLYKIDRPIQVELLGIVNSRDYEEIDCELARLKESGYKTIKVKVGWDVDKDLEKVKFIHARISKGMKIRIDANQAYRYDDAYKFVTSIPPDHIELFEQPFQEGNWEDMKRLSNNSPIPLMLDESIYDTHDIDKAIQLQCSDYIKLKLMKASSAALLREMVQKIEDHCMKAVLGNGIATDIGCYQEAVLSANLCLKTAGEMNGFLKTITPVSDRSIHYDKNYLVVSPDFLPKVDISKISPFIIHQAIYE
ncbi:mandelate racemase/muconate lactonizing enzyme family protein [Effusibacillus dendaii]|uniref:Dipeptide epimerase n=1 Tax=Effusibacillus dendaii TaxID=2743772 RepID=A0A7I8DFG9_9BACL|nr:enolase C-terminal domain-like protein [Effusibacillus dendaii]BCJ87699.1 dipeptide epimerase [Effusibacillus dendaii]